MTYGPVKFGFKPMQHGYGYVYQYRTDTDMRIRQFLKKPDTWIRFFYLFLQKIKDIKIVAADRYVWMISIDYSNHFTPNCYFYL